MNKPCNARPGRAGTIAGAVAALFAASCMPSALANPTGGQVVSGTVNINSPGAGRMNIVQNSPNAIVNWNTFSIGSSEAVTIVQPSAAAALLNRVTGNDPSVIAGALRANGKVFLVNPAGVIFAPGSSVNVGSLVASTLNISNSDFLAGNYRFVGASVAPVSNAGSLTAESGGTIALLGGAVSNSGTVSARLGTVALGAGNDITLDFAGDGLTTIKINQGAANALIGNTGTLAADGGMVVMSAQTADALAGTVINQQGIVRAQSLAERDGHIVLDGGTNGVMQVSGTLDATGGAGLTGGKVDVTGYNVSLLAGTTVDASGATGGGTVRVGGGAGGADPDIRNANAISMSPTASIEADALDTGNGGHVVAFSKTLSNLYGTLSAKGGPQGGDGGLIETSGTTLDLNGVTIDASAPKGRPGTWLIDPSDVEICAAGSGGNCPPLRPVVGEGATPPPSATLPTPPLADGTTPLPDALINRTLNAGTSVLVKTTDGSITVDGAAAIQGTSAQSTTLTLNASGAITFQYGASVTTAPGAGPLGVIVDANVGGTPLTAAANNVTLNGTTIDTNGGQFTIGDSAQTAVNVTTSTVHTEGGAININGVTSGGTAVAIGYSLLSSTSGSITVTGNTGGGNGVNISQSAIQTVDGQGTITGTGVATEGFASGVYMGLQYGGGTTTVPTLQATGSGTFTVTGTLTGVSGYGIELQNAAVSMGSGTVSLNGTATMGATTTERMFGVGVEVTSTPIATTGGGITINGSAPVTRAGLQDATGTEVENSQLTTTGAGNVTLIGNANGSGNVGVPLGYGIHVGNSSIQVANGAVNFNGTSNAAASQAAYGVLIEGGYFVTEAASSMLPAIDATGTGSMTITGTATAQSAFGVQINSAILQGATGALGMTGTARASTTGAGATALEASGVDLETSNVQTTAGNVSLNGAVYGPAAPLVGDTGNGVLMNGSSIGTVDGNISATGNTVGSNGNGSFGAHAKGVVVQGMYAAGAGAFTSSGAGAIALTGTSGGISGTGVSLTGTTASTTTGAISLTGTIATSTDGFGVLLQGASMSTTSGNVTVNGTVTGPAGLNSYAFGVDLIGGYSNTESAIYAPAIMTGSGNIAVSGSVPATQFNDAPEVYMGSFAINDSDASINSTSGSIALSGVTTGTPTAGNLSTGVLLDGSDGAANVSPLTVASGTGKVSIFGSGSGADSQGVLIADAARITGSSVDIRGVVTSPAVTANGGNIQYDYGTLILNGSVSATQPGGVMSITGSTNTSDAGLAFGAVPLSNATYRFVTADAIASPRIFPYAAGAVAINGAAGGSVVLRAANDNTSESLVSRNATVAGNGGTLSIFAATVDPSTFALTAQNATPITLFGTSGAMTIDPVTYATFVNFQTLTLGSDTQTGLITVNGVCASGGGACAPTRPNVGMNLTLSNPAEGSQGIQLPDGLSMSANYTLSLISAGPVTDPGGIRAANLLLAGRGTFTLNDPQNDVGVLALVNAGNVNFLDSHGFLIGPVTAQTYSASAGQLTTIDGSASTVSGNLSAQAASGNVALNTGLNVGGTADLVMEMGVFDAGGAGALSATNGWRIWANTWTGETRGKVQPDTAQPNFYGCMFGAGCSWGGTVSTTGDHYVYLQRPTVTITANGATRVSGAPNPAFTYSSSGLVNGDAAPGALSGAVTSPATQFSSPGQYPINPSFASSVGYIVNDVPGTLTITQKTNSPPPPIPPTPDPISKSGLQTFFSSEEQTFVYENNLQGTNICVGSNQPLFSTTPTGDNDDILAVEWKRVRSQPNLNSCLVVNSQHGCGDF